MSILLFQLYVIIIIWLIKYYLKKSLGDLPELIDKVPYNINYCYVNKCFSGASKKKKEENKGQPLKLRNISEVKVQSSGFIACLL